jgi:cytochrome c oxidase subunit 3
MILGLYLTILLGVVFTGLQGMEYIEAPFTISDSIYGTTFFMTTGLHGVHVIIGTLALVVAFIRSINYHYTRKHHLGLEGAILY